MTVAHYLRAAEGRKLPNYIGVNPIVRYDGFVIAGPAYLGEGYAPFAVTGDPNAPNFRVPNIGLSAPEEYGRFAGRTDLHRNLSAARRALDQSRSPEGIDRFQEQALNLLTSPDTARAFDLNLENPRLRDRYGRHAWGQQLLMARRLVEAGVEIVTTELSGPQCGRCGNWDDHATDHHIFEAYMYRAPVYDQAVTALIEDIHDRGLDRRVLVVVTG